MKLQYLSVIMLSAALVLFGGLAQASAQEVPVAGMITMVDLGAKTCIPCKMMAPVLEKLKNDFAGRAAIVFIDVWKNRDQADHFKVQVIPTQIFFDPAGKEVYRHVGFMSEEDIVAQLKKMNVPSLEDDKK